MNPFSLRRLPDVFCRGACFAMFFFAVGSLMCAAQAPAPGPDTLVLANGDTLHGKLVKETGGKVTFHQDQAGDVTVKWADVRELHTTESFGLIDKTVKTRSKKNAGGIPVGTLDVQNAEVTVHPHAGVGGSKPIPVDNAAYLVDQATLEQQVNHRPGIFAGWNGAATAGVTIVEATQSQFTESGSIGLVRVVPAVAWLDPVNRTSVDFSGSSGRISEPGTPTVKTAIYHADAERDQYFSARFFGLAQVAFDHNFSQGLALQSIYGGGIGYTVLKNARQELDVKATIQYEKQEFLTPPGATTGTPSTNLVGSTFALDYAAKWKLFSFVQEAAFIPSYNVPSAYSANETNTLTFPAYKNLGFSMGTLDSYLNNPPASVPPTRPNSFQFTMGLSYAIKSKY